jgi:hypothetical protein
MEAKISLPCSHEPETGTDSEPDESSLHAHNLLPKNPFYYYPPAGPNDRTV